MTDTLSLDSTAPHDADWHVVQPLSSEEQVEAQRHAEQAEQVAAAAAQQQTTAATGNDDMQCETDDAQANTTLLTTITDSSLEERRMADMNAASASSSSLPLSSPPSAVDINAALDEEERLEELERKREADAAAAAEAERKKAARVPTLFRSTCKRCSAVLQFPYPTRLLHCCMCGLINAISASTQVVSSSPMIDLTLKQQAQQWNTMQVCVFLKSLKLEQLTPIFEANHVDGKQLLELTYYDVKDILRIQKPGDIENVLNCINILRGTAVATPNDLLKQEAAAENAEKKEHAQQAQQQQQQQQQSMAAAAVPSTAAIASPSTHSQQIKSEVPLAPTPSLPPSFLPSTSSTASIASVASSSSVSPSQSSSSASFPPQLHMSTPSALPSGASVVSSHTQGPHAHAHQQQLQQQQQNIMHPQSVPSPQPSTTSIAHFSTGGMIQGEGTTQHARHMLEQQQTNEKDDNMQQE